MSKDWEDVIQDIAEKYNILIPVQVEEYLDENYECERKQPNTISLDDLKDEIIGKEGTLDRDEYDKEILEMLKDKNR